MNFENPHRKQLAKAKVRGTPNNTGDGLKMALEIGATKHGLYDGCHALHGFTYEKLWWFRFRTK